MIIWFALFSLIGESITKISLSLKQQQMNYLILNLKQLKLDLDMLILPVEMNYDMYTRQKETYMPFEHCKISS